ncbi:AsmA-like C-terminal region-containing protein [Escherichia coli]
MDYDLHWRKAPWQPDEATLNGIIHTQLGKGEITEINTGHAGQLLRLLSVDALMRKLRFDFRDTFGEGFYFDSIRSTAWIKDGVMHTDDTLVDGLEADIAMKGSVNLVRRDLNIGSGCRTRDFCDGGRGFSLRLTPLLARQYLQPVKCWGRCGAKSPFCAITFGSAGRSANQRSVAPTA